MVVTWNTAFEATPAGTDQILAGDDRIRELKNATREQIQGGDLTYATALGTSAAYTVTLGTSPTAMAIGQRFYVMPTHAANATAATVTVNALGSIAVYKDIGAATTIQVEASDMMAARMYQLAMITPSRMEVLNPSPVNLYVKGQKVQSFDVEVVNVTGALLGRIVAFSLGGSPSTTATFSDKVNGASGTRQTIPTGADASTAFTGGLKIGSAEAYKLWLDTAAQVVADCFGIATIEYSDTGLNVRVALAVGDSVNINGNTRIRPALYLTHALTGSAVNWNASNITTGLSIITRYIGVMA